jgi:hypothetical protein
MKVSYLPGNPGLCTQVGDKHSIDRNHMTVEIDALTFGSGILPSSSLPLQAPRFKVP